MAVPCVKCAKVLEIAESDPEREVVCEACQATELAAPQKAAQKPSYWVSDDDLSSPAPAVAHRAPMREADLNSSLVDIRTIMEESTIPPPSKRRIDDDLIRLQANAFTPRVPPPPPAISVAHQMPAADAAPTVAASEADAPPASSRPLTTEAMPDLPNRDVSAAQASPMDSDRPHAVSPRERARALAPWGAGAAALLVAVVWFSSGGEPDAADAAQNPAQANAMAAEAQAAAPPPAEVTAAPAPAPTSAPAPKRIEPKAAATVDSAGAEPTRPAAVDSTDKAASGEPRGPFNRGAAMTALSGAAGKAAGCRKPSEPKGMAKVTVTFAPNGKPSSVSVAPPYGGTKTGTCVAGAFRSASVPAFEGQSVPASKSVSLR
jgi:hypothetical protein